MNLRRKLITTVVYTDNYISQRDTLLPLSEVKKLEQAIDVHGYRGASKKRHNGIVPIRPEDKQLWKSLKCYLMKDKLVIPENLTFFADVKVVAHVPSGHRIVGQLYIHKESNKLSFYAIGFANYSHRIK